jgi:hypothetical protein
MRRKSVTADKYVRGTRSDTFVNPFRIKVWTFVRTPDPGGTRLGGSRCVHSGPLPGVEIHHGGRLLAAGEGLGPHRRACVAPETHVGSPVEFVEPS